MKPLDKKPSVGFEKILKSVAMGNTDPEVLSTLVSRIARVSKSFGEEQLQKLETIAMKQLDTILGNILHAIDNDTIYSMCEKEYELTPGTEPTEQQRNTSRKKLAKQALFPFYNPKFRDALMDAKRDSEQTIDTVSIDQVLFSGYSQEAKDASKSLIDNFATFLEENKEELLLIQKYYSHSYREKISYKELKKFEDALQSKQLLSNQERLREALETMYPGKVIKPDSFATTDYISLVEFVGDNTAILQPYSVSVDEKYESWLDEQATAGHTYTPEQRQRLDLMKDQVSNSLSLTNDDFSYGPLAQAGGLGLAWSLFGEKLDKVVDEMNDVLVK